MFEFGLGEPADQTSAEEIETRIAQQRNQLQFYIFSESLGPQGERVVMINDGRQAEEPNYACYSLTPDELSVLEADIATSMPYDPRTTLEARAMAVRIAQVVGQNAGTAMPELLRNAFCQYPEKAIAPRVFASSGWDLNNLSGSWGGNKTPLGPAQRVEGICYLRGGFIAVYMPRAAEMAQTPLFQDTAADCQEELVLAAQSQALGNLTEEIIHLAQDFDLPGIVAEVLAKNLKTRIARQIAEASGIIGSLPVEAEAVACYEACKLIEQKLLAKFPGLPEHPLDHLSFGTFDDSMPHDKSLNTAALRKAMLYCVQHVGEHILGGIAGYASLVGKGSPIEDV